MFSSKILTADYDRVFIRKLEGCIVWNDAIQYSPEAVRNLCTSCLLPVCDDA